MEDNKIYKVINTERLNIVEADGTLKLAMFNSQNMAPLMMDGKDLLPGHRAGDGVSGMIFYNTEGDECGGLIYGCSKLPDGGYHSGLSMTFDQYKNDQVVHMTLEEQNGIRQYGFRIYDRPNEHIGESVKRMEQIQKLPDGDEKKRRLAESRKGNAERMFVGKRPDGSVGVYINDGEGHARLRVMVDAQDVAHVEVLDESGKVVKTLV